MALMWTESMSVGVKEFDLDHQRLIRMIDNMQSVLHRHQDRGQIPPEEIENTLDELEKYFRGHCYREEHAMARTGFPGFEEHREEHHWFITRVTELSFQARGSSSPDHGKELVEFMFQWLANHIIVTDRKYTEYLNRKGIH